MTPPLQFYKSSLCPRCLLVGRALAKLRREYAGLEVEEIDVVAHPLRSWQAGVRIIPALKAGDELLAGVFLEEKEIRRFVVRYLAGSGPEKQPTP